MFYSRSIVKSQGGYTILELMVVVSIIMALLLVATSNYPKIQMRAALTRAAYKFEQDMRRLQGKTLSYKISGDLIAGYGAYINLSNEESSSQYILYADRVPADQTYDFNDDISEIITLESGIMIKEVNNVVGNLISIDFNAPKADVIITPVAASDHMCVVFAAKSYPDLTRLVLVNTRGLIEVVPNDQGCP